MARSAQIPTLEEVGLLDLARRDAELALVPQHLSAYVCACAAHHTHTRTRTDRQTDTHTQTDTQPHTHTHIRTQTDTDTDTRVVDAVFTTTQQPLRSREASRCGYLGSKGTYGGKVMRRPK